LGLRKRCDSGRSTGLLFFFSSVVMILVKLIKMFSKETYTEASKGSICLNKLRVQNDLKEGNIYFDLISTLLLNTSLKTFRKTKRD
jgi:hypothetical protein